MAKDITDIKTMCLINLIEIQKTKNNNNDIYFNIFVWKTVNNITYHCML